MLSEVVVELTIDQLQVHRVVGFSLDRTLGRPARAKLDVRMLGEVPPEALLGQSATLQFGHGAVEHVFSGIIDAASSVATRAETRGDSNASWRLRLELTSILGLLEHSVTSRIFQELSVPDIVSAVLEEHGLGGDKQQWRLDATYPKRSFCVQYEEDALSFCHRLLEKEGIYYAFRSDEGTERVLFEDRSAGCDPIEGAADVAFVGASGLQQQEAVVHRIDAVHRVTTGAFVLRDYDFEKPDLDLTSEVSEGDAALCRYDFPGGYTEAAEGKRYAQVALEAERAERHRLEVVGNVARLTEGRRITLTDADKHDGDYFVASVQHRYEAIGEDERPELRMNASLLPIDIPFRAPQITPRPIIDGPQTASVVAPEGAPPETVHTDEWGRCKVKFHWDLDEAMDDRASCWIRTQQMQTSGSMILPRVDWEVVVEFQQGDPDRPLVTGRVYNGRYKPPYALPEGKTRMSLGSATSPGGGGRNEIRFEDAAGKEEISIKAEKNLSVATGNNKTKTTGADDSQSVAANRTLNVGANQTVRVTSTYQNTVAGAQTQSVGGNRNLGVNAVMGLSTPSMSTSVGGNQFEMDGNPLAGLIDLATDMAKDAAQAAAKDAMAALDEAVKGKVDAVMGPIDDLQGKLGSIQKGMDAAKSGDLSGMADAASETAGLPTPGEIGDQIKGQALAGAKEKMGSVPGSGFAGESVNDGFGAAEDALGMGEKTGKSSGGGQNGGGGQGDGGGGHGGGGDGVVSKKSGGGQNAGSQGGSKQGPHDSGPVDGGGEAGEGGTFGKKSKGGQTGGGGGGGEQSTMGKAQDMLDAARGGNISAASGLDEMVTKGIDENIQGAANAAKDALGVGKSGKNFPGPPGGISGDPKADNTCGPGHSVHQVAATYKETIGSLRATIAAGDINTNIGATRTQTIGAARIELVRGLRAEACADKTETAAGLVVVTGGDEGEDVGGTKTSNIGGALLAKVGANAQIAAGGAAAFIGALHKVDASGKITFNCGASSVVIDGGGVTIKSPMVNIAGAKISQTSTVAEGPGGGAGGGGGAGPGGATGGGGGAGGGAQGGAGGGGGGAASTGGSGQDKGAKDGRGKGADQGKGKGKRPHPEAARPPKPPVTDTDRKLAASDGNSEAQRKARKRVAKDAIAKKEKHYYPDKDKSGNPVGDHKSRPLSHKEQRAEADAIDYTQPVSSDGPDGIVHHHDEKGNPVASHGDTQHGHPDSKPIPGYPPQDEGDKAQEDWDNEEKNHWGHDGQ
jgi:type VI secretion system secreted protein VgrG